MKLSKKWTYRDPQATVTYSAGTEADTLPARHRAAADSEGVLEGPAPKATDTTKADKKA